MSKLIYAQLMRLRRSWLFWLVLAGIAAISAYRCADDVHNAGYFEWMLFEMSPYFCFLYAGFIGLFVGTEYSDGAMRNKLVVGHTRAAVYGANLTVSALACVSFQLVMFVVMWIIGPLNIGMLDQPGVTVFYMLCALLVSVAFAAAFTAISMTCSNKAGGIVLAIGIAFLMFFVSAQLDDLLSAAETIQVGPTIIEQMEDGSLRVEPPETAENPHYIPEGPLRDALSTINSFLPVGQTIGLMDLYSLWRGVWPETIEYWYWPILSLLFTAAVTAGGLSIYKKKDIK